MATAPPWPGAGGGYPGGPGAGRCGLLPPLLPRRSCWPTVQLRSWGWKQVPRLLCEVPGKGETSLPVFSFSLQRVCILFSFVPAQGAALRCVYFLWTINGAVTPVPVSGSLPRSVRAQLPFQGEWGQFYFRGLRGLHLQAPRGSGCLPCGAPASGAGLVAGGSSLLSHHLPSQAVCQLRPGREGGASQDTPQDLRDQPSPCLTLCPCPDPSFRKAGLPLLRHTSATHTATESVLHVSKCDQAAPRQIIRMANF